MSCQFNFFTSYNTFFITSDNGASISPNWIKDLQSFNQDRLLQAKNLLAIKTGSYGHIKGTIDILISGRKQFKLENYDHVVEGWLDVKSGVLQFLECPGSELQFEIKVNPGKYRVRVYSSNLANTDADEYEGNDSYNIEVWPDDDIQPKVLKQYTAD